MIFDVGQEEPTPEQKEIQARELEALKLRAKELGIPWPHVDHDGPRCEDCPPDEGMRFGAEFDESKHPRDADGKFAERAGKVQRQIDRDPHGDKWVAQWAEIQVSWGELASEKYADGGEVQAHEATTFLRETCKEMTGSLYVAELGSDWKGDMQKHIRVVGMLAHAKESGLELPGIVRCSESWVERDRGSEYLDKVKGYFHAGRMDVTLNPRRIFASTSHSSTQDPSHTLVHEVGHFHHCTRVSARTYAAAGQEYADWGGGAEMREMREDIKEWPSEYSKVNPHEFVAEVYAKAFLEPDFPIPDEWMKHYDRLGGPPLKRAKR